MPPRHHISQSTDGQIVTGNMYPSYYDDDRSVRACVSITGSKHRRAKLDFSICYQHLEGLKSATLPEAASKARSLSLDHLVAPAFGRSHYVPPLIVDLEPAAAGERQEFGK